MELIFWMQLLGSILFGVVALGFIIYYGIKRYNSKGREDFKERDF